MIKEKLVRIKGIVVTLTLIVSMGIMSTVSLAEETVEDRARGINQGIANLQYNKDEVLAIKGDTIENVVPREGIWENGNFIVLEHTKKSLTSAPVDISIVDSIKDRTYPGAILIGDEDYVKNRPTILMTERKPLNITIDLPGMNNSTMTVNQPVYGNVNSSINQLINAWINDHSDSYTVPARTQYNESMVYSKNQLKVSLNIDVDIADQLLGIDFEGIHKGEQTYMVAAYKQIFYTVSASLPNKPSDLFGPSVTFQELTQKGISNEAPPLMVSNVAYGRTIYVVLNTSSQSTEVEAAFKALIKGINIEAGSEFERIINNSSFTIVVMGGDAHEHNKLITTDFNEIREIIKNNSAFNAQNPGYPISYTSSFVKDNTLAAVHCMTDYVETKSTEYKKGRIFLEHSGGYVAQFNVQWDEVSYDAQGNEVLEHKAWEGNDINRTAHYTAIINLKPNTKNISIKAKECTGLAWDWWRTVVDEVSLPISGEITVHISGTTLHPDSEINQ